MRGFLSGRLGRRRYWAIVAAIAAVCASATVVLKLQTGLAAGLLWLGAAVGRLHDLGRSGWWAVGLLAFDAGALMAAALVGPLMVGPIAYLGALLLIACTVWLGVAKGEPCGNRFGQGPAEESDPAAA